MVIITLTTDFGDQDAYVATMKGVILDINPEVTIVDICHSVEPQNIAQAAFIIGTTCDYFPQDTIHMVIVDPGVGSQRRAIAMKTRRAFFVAPDNGVLSYIINASPEEPEAVNLTNPKFWHHPVSSTFHGRDIFAPAAAHISLGVPLAEFGEAITSLSTSPLPHPQTAANGELIGHILHIDRFGNLISDISKEDLRVSKLSLEIAGQQIDGLSTSYAEADKLLALLGSSGHLEIAFKNGSAASFLDVRIGDEIRIKES
jgi:S-adenosylmethionine hydrolase